MKILVLGGYGTFGGRLVRLLAHDERLILMIAGRSLTAAQRFCDTLPAGAQKVVVYFDRDADIETHLGQIKPDLLVDASGPFQSYGDQPYRVVDACIANGINYMDLADATDFVKGIDCFDRQARDRDVFVLSGASTFPVLGTAVVKKLSEGMSRVTSVTGGVAPSPHAGIGLSVIRAICGYSGRPVQLMRDGKVATAYALTESMRYTIAPPGRLPLRNIRFSLIDVPDLTMLAQSRPELLGVWIGAGSVPEVLHRLLNGLAWLVRWRLLPSLSIFARLFHQVIRVLRWGERRGGMFISVDGMDNAGQKRTRSWHLLAEGNDGPMIPSIAAAALIVRHLDGSRPAAGARPAAHDLALEDYDRFFGKFAIHTGYRELREVDQATLYQRVLGDAWSSLPPQLQAMHNCKGELQVAGIAEVERGTSIFARIAALIVGFPESGRDVPVQVDFRSGKDGELWRRTFAGKSFSSFQSEGCGRSDKLVAEKFGPFTFGLALVLDDGRLNLVVRNWSFLGIPLPGILAPNGDSYEHVVDGRFCFNVEIAHPLIGLIVRYRGWLVPVEKQVR